MHRSIILGLVAACAGPTASEKPGPRGLRADQHLALAAREEESAQRLTRWPEVRPGADGTTRDPQIAAGAWAGSWDTSAEHDRLVQSHRSAAAQLEAEYDAACEGATAATASISPIQRFATGGYPVEGGVVLLLTSEVGSPDALLAAMRCHRAWMMLGRSNMDDCPLDLPGIRISAKGDARGIELTITEPDARLVAELQRRATHDLETGLRRRAR
jgi:hypothetical protein